MSPPIRPPACTPFGESRDYVYAYRPGLEVGVAFSVLFGLVGLFQAWLTIRYRISWMLFFVVGAGLESLGWIGRTVNHVCAYSHVMFTMQTATLIMGPAWTQAGVYVAFWVIIAILGSQVCPVSPKRYLLLCFFVDVVCLTLQATGGGLAGTESAKGESTSLGTTIMVVGIISQLVSTLFFSILVGLVLARGWSLIINNRPVLLVFGAIVLSTTMMVLRGVYRSIELVQGWRGYLISREAYVIALDAVPMLVAMSILALFNPGLIIDQHRPAVKDADEEEKRVDGRDTPRSGSDQIMK